MHVQLRPDVRTVTGSAAHENTDVMVSHSRADGELREIDISPVTYSAIDESTTRPMDLLGDGASRLGIQLDDFQIGQFARYYREILAWNSRVNLTRVTGPEEVQTRHFVDSLSAASALPDGGVGSPGPA